jgi:hypothetical protein
MIQSTIIFLRLVVDETFNLVFVCTQKSIAFVENPQYDSQFCMIGGKKFSIVLWFVCSVQFPNSRHFWTENNIRQKDNLTILTIVPFFLQNNERPPLVCDGIHVQNMAMPPSSAVGGTVPTSLITFVETEHGRLRRRQRGIDKKDLQSAIKYGTRSGNFPRPNGDKTYKYSYKNIVYIVNDATGEEVTSYSVPVRLDEVPISQVMQRDHDEACVSIQRNLDSWTSNTVLVVDTSGSMKKADVWGGRNRLGSVWMAVALDFVANRIESRNAVATDVVSIVTLEEGSRTVIQEQPCNWVLYNKIVSIYNDKLVSPFGHGPFLPSLNKAETLLLRNDNAACAISLTFLSDGRPSDSFLDSQVTFEEWNDRIEKKVGILAKAFGRRFTFHAVGIGDYEDFDVLERMVAAADDFGARAEFSRPSMTSTAIGEVFSSVATSVSSTQLELTDANTKKQRRVRAVERESKRKASTNITKVSESDFFIYGSTRINRSVYKEWHEGRVLRKAYETVPLQHLDACFVAFAKGPFGEGAERMAYRFFELARDGKSIVGKHMVAKESRLILDENVANEAARKKFARTFCSTQQLARRLSKEFNDKLDRTRRVDIKTPRVNILDCSIYELDDIELGKLTVLVEEKLDHNKWQKWNSNNGYVDGMGKAPEFSEERLREAFTNLTKIEQNATIAEGSEEEDSDGEEVSLPFPQTVTFTPFEVAQAFSHFTYWATGKKRLVCDLQGVYDDKRNILDFSDPVIHYYNHLDRGRRKVHGGTDHGKDGMAKFFDTHHEHCGRLCKLVIRGFRRVTDHPRYAHKR